MIVLKCSSGQIVWPRKEYAVALSCGNWPNGDPCECLDIYTPIRKYSLMGIDSSGVQTYELLDQILEEIRQQEGNPVAYVDVDEICYRMEPMTDLILDLIVE